MKPSEKDIIKNIEEFYEECHEYRTIFDDYSDIENLLYYKYINRNDFRLKKFIKIGSLLITFANISAELQNISHNLKYDYEDILIEILACKSNDFKGEFSLTLDIILKWLTLLVNDKDSFFDNENTIQELMKDSKNLYDLYLDNNLEGSLSNI